MGRQSGVAAAAAAAKRRREEEKREKRKASGKDDDSDETSSEEPPPKKRAVPPTTSKSVVKAKNEEKEDEKGKPLKKSPEPTLESTSKIGSVVAAQPPKAASTDKGEGGTQGKVVSASMSKRERKMLKRAKPAAVPEAVVEADSAEKKVSRMAHLRKEGTIFVGGFAPTVDLDAFRKLFEGCGEVSKFVIPMRDTRGNRPAQPKGIAFITYVSQQGVKRALGKNLKDFEGRALKVQVAKDEDKKKEEQDKKDRIKDKTSPADLTLFVRNMPYVATEQQVKEYFKQFGKVLGLRICKNKDGKPKGIVFVKFCKKEGLESALEEKERDFEGRTIYLAKQGQRSADDEEERVDKLSAKDNHVVKSKNLAESDDDASS